MADTGVIHIVHFQFKAGTSESDKQHVRYLGPDSEALLDGADPGIYI